MADDRQTPDTTSAPSRCQREGERFFAAVRFYTRLPVPAGIRHSDAAQAQSLRYFPAVGLIVGAIAALVYTAATLIWPTPVAIVLSMAASIYVTGAFHEDGLSDTADGLGGGWNKEHILAIMKDSRVGTFGVVAVVLALLGKFTLLSAFESQYLPWALLAGHALSRACATLLLARLDYVRNEGQSKSRPLAQQPGLGTLCIAWGFAALGLAVLSAMGLPGDRCLSALLLAALATLWLARLFQHWLGGVTGDCLGATQQVSELAFYLGLLAQWPG